MVKITRKSLVEKRLLVCRRIVRVDTQRLRCQLMVKLKDMFDAAHCLAQQKDLNLNTRQKWMRVAAYAAQVINSLASGFDERQIDKDLDKLEVLVNEATAKKEAGKAQA